MVGDGPKYVAYLLRLWQAHERWRSFWRASLQSPHNRERVSFRTLGELFTWLLWGLGFGVILLRAIERVLGMTQRDWSEMFAQVRQAESARTKPGLGTTANLESNESVALRWRPFAAFPIRCSVAATRSQSEAQTRLTG
jgi:hypothetical protein